MITSWCISLCSLFGLFPSDRFPHKGKNSKSMYSFKVLIYFAKLISQKAIPLCFLNYMWENLSRHTFLLSLLRYIELHFFFFVIVVLSRKPSWGCCPFSCIVGAQLPPLFLPFHLHKKRVLKEMGLRGPLKRRVHPSSHLNELGGNTEGLLENLTWLRTGI